MSKSRILILTICSNTKTREGESSEYHSADAIIKCLPKTFQDLLDGRLFIRNLITGSNVVSRDGKLLRELPFNNNIRDGPDFQLSSMPAQGLYLPAVRRYTGRFYTKLGTRADSLLAGTRHHMLIISGLYGLLKPLESIQCYSCNVRDHPAIANCWTEDDCLSRLLTEYILRFGIVKVFDFTAENDYRNLVSWEMIRRAAKGNVLHCFSAQYAGAALLPSLGTFARILLQEPEDDLLKMKAGDSRKIPDDEIHFQPLPVPESSLHLAHEIKQQMEQLSINDKIGRMRRNINKVLSGALWPNDSAHNFGERTRDLETLSLPHAHEMARLMREFERIRNAVEYEDHHVGGAEWTRICASYENIERWGRSHKFVNEAVLEKIDV